jgi:YVTN family beta-propeller protein
MTRFGFVVAILAALLTGCTEEITCAAGDSVCGKRCVSIAVDPENCGGCGIRCGSHEACEDGACVCAAGAIPCGESCVDVVTDPEHCGGCGEACAPGEFCRADAPGAGCDTACPDPDGATLTACGHACVDLASDRFHCGACDRACGNGEGCHDGTCAPDLFVSCFATDDVRPLHASLRRGLPQRAGDGPAAVALEGARLHVASSLSHSVTTFAATLRGPGVERILGGEDFENVVAHGGRLYVANSGGGTIIVIDGATGAVVDEVDLADKAGVNPRGITFVGDLAYVALMGRDAESGGQEVAVVDFAGAAGIVTKRIPVATLVPGPGLAFPTGAASIGTTVYVTLANLKLGMFGYTDPAGPSKLAVIDTADGDALLALDLGEGCMNAGDVAAEGGRVWVTCGGTGNVLPVDVAGGAPVGGAPVATGLGGPWSIAFCGGMGYVTDAWGGNVFSFDPAGVATSTTVEVCPPGPQGWTFASDVACGH